MFDSSTPHLIYKYLHVDEQTDNQKKTCDFVIANSVVLPEHVAKLNYFLVYMKEPIIFFSLSRKAH